MASENESDEESDSVVAPTSVLDDLARKLCAAVFGPIVAVLEGCKQLLIAPDGQLSLLPLEVLLSEAGSRLIDEYQISYVATGRDVLRFVHASSDGATDPLIVANPNYDLVIERRDGQRDQRAVTPAPVGRLSRDMQRDGEVSFDPLSGTAVEGNRIAEMFPDSQTWMQNEALDGRLKAIRSPRILHVATHGFFLEDRPYDSLLDQQLGVRSIQQEPTGGLSVAGMENPLLRSGLALAGVNSWFRHEAMPPEAEDGILTAEDVTGIDLLDTELVVLSACETGLGQVRNGEGVFGLRRAFVLAGARTLVMSLWKVADQETQELICDFYRRLLDGDGRAAALRHAQRSLKERCPDPYVWGAFICQGEISPLRLSELSARQAGLR